MTNGLSPAAVPQVELCPGGPLLSQFVYGTWRLMDATDPALTTPSAVLARIRKCLDLGITTFDCVCVPMLLDICVGANVSPGSLCIRPTFMVE